MKMIPELTVTKSLCNWNAEMQWLSKKEENP